MVSPLLYRHSVKLNQVNASSITPRRYCLTDDADDVVPNFLVQQYFEAETKRLSAGDRAEEQEQEDEEHELRDKAGGKNLRKRKMTPVKSENEGKGKASVGSSKAAKKSKGTKGEERVESDASGDKAPSDSAKKELKKATQQIVELKRQLATKEQDLEVRFSSALALVVPARFLSFFCGLSLVPCADRHARQRRHCGTA